MYLYSNDRTMYTVIRRGIYSAMPSPTIKEIKRTCSMTWEPLLDFRNEKIRTLLGRNKENELQDLEDVAVKSQNPIDLLTWDLEN